MKTWMRAISIAFVISKLFIIFILHSNRYIEYKLILNTLVFMAMLCNQNCFIVPVHKRFDNTYFEISTNLRSIINLNKNDLEK